MQATAYGAPLEAEPDKWSRDDLLRAYERGVWTFPRLRNLGHGTTPFRGEKNTNWEGSYRVPAMIRWLRSLVDRIELNPREEGEGLDATLHGDLAEILSFCAQPDRKGQPNSLPLEFASS
jgi:hypothetical protein